MDDPEVRAGTGAEVRIHGRTLAGRVMVYGLASPSHHERFEGGAFAPVPAVPLNIQHDRAMVVAPAGGFELRDTSEALEVRAELPKGSAALALVRSGALTGFSVEFHSRGERREDGIRVVERAELVGVGLVDHPSYPGATAEVRARGGRGGRLGTIRGRVHTGKTLDCKCSPGNCTKALFKNGAFDDIGDRPEVLAVVGEFANAIASKKKGGVRFWQKDGNLEYAIDVPNSQRGVAFMETLDSVPVVGRPYLDADASTVSIADGLATYDTAAVRAIILGPTDADSGWTPLVLGKPGEGAPPAARRARVWL